jgi:DNA-binding IscR family transcriptional regulator
LARLPDRIRLYDVFVLFEAEAPDTACPFGGGVCGVGKNCPLHDRFRLVHDEINAILHDTTFGAYGK